jgi:TetR/AcrR family transcriptional regulator
MIQWTHHQHSVIESWGEHGLMAKIDPYYLLFMIWGTTQFYADFDTEITLLKGRELTDDEFLQAQEFTVSTILRGLNLAVSSS